MADTVEFRSNGTIASGYLVKPPAGSGAGILVIQEWWGLVEHIQDVVDRFAAEGFVAIAPDLYHGKTTQSPDEAGRLLMELDAEREIVHEETAPILSEIRSLKADVAELRKALAGKT